MLSWLYLIFIYPLELFYQGLYQFFHAFTGSYGWGLICLSVVSTLIYTPLKDLAAKIQDRERAIQAVLGPQLKALKAQSQGAERHERMKNLYRRYAYHPIYGLRSMLGVMLQVPFLIAAYNMLASYDRLAGQAFGPISDLSRPDALLLGLNFLPILMTLFNIGALYTTKSFTTREHLQGLLIAALFLILLYTAPAALLVYWTANNALLLLVNLKSKITPRASGRKSPRLEAALAEFKNRQGEI